MKHLLSFLTPLALCLPLIAQSTDTTLTITISGTLGPVVSGSDPLGANGSTATATAMISESATPKSSTANLVTYILPAGAVTATLGNGLSFSNTSPWKMRISLENTYDMLVLAGPGPLGLTVNATCILKRDSWSTAVLTNPTTFGPSPQRLTGTNSTLKYTFGGETTALGLTGAISNRATAGAAPPEDDGAVPSSGPAITEAAPDTTLSLTVNGTLGPVLSGSDPLEANGETGTLTVTASESLSPTATTANSATYTLPAGAMSVVIGGTTFKTTGQSTMKITLGSKVDTVVLSAAVKELGISATVVATAMLKVGSFPSSVLIHPAPFSPSPQRLTAATSAGGGGSKVKYTALGSSTILGLAGGASNRAAASVIADDGEAQ